ncbi:MAG TPA: response regulator [Gallionella sp.]|nr:response regulator [Gallionella sp.]
MLESRLSEKVFVVDDDDAMRDSIHWLLESVDLQTKMFVCAKDFLDYCEAEQKGCLLLDVRMPGMSGMELLETLKSRGIMLPIIIITGHGDVPMAVRALKHGAFDFIQKPFNSQELLDRVHAALKQDRERHQRCSEIDRRRAHLAVLTERETEVMTLVAEGHSSKVIAQKLGISPKTVDIHRANMMRKLNVRTVVEIVQLTLHLDAH